MPLELAVDLRHGGRWTSLRAGDREWLWSPPDPAVGAARRRVLPDASFVDAGGMEECFPTVRGRPDHGAAWSRSWDGTPHHAGVSLPGSLRLQREIRSAPELQVHYEVTGPPGTRFLHAVHALLELSPDARIEVPQARLMTVLDPSEAVRPWPCGLDRFGPDDGTAVCVLIPGVSLATVADGDQVLRLAWNTPDRSDLCSLLLWRNLRGWPETDPYRSIGVEPLIGRAADLSTADPADCAQLPGLGSVPLESDPHRRRRPLTSTAGPLRWSRISGFSAHRRAYGR